MPPWSHLVIHVSGFVAYAGALSWAHHLARPGADPDQDGQARRYARAARLPIWALLAAVALMVFAGVRHSPVAMLVWAINCAVAVLFMRAMRRMSVLARGKLQAEKQTEKLVEQIRKVHERRDQSRYRIEG
jgi:hypothetical protein